MRTGRPNLKLVHSADWAEQPHWDPVSKAQVIDVVLQRHDFVVEMVGDAMAPAISHGEQALIDPNQFQAHSSGQLWLVSIGTNVMLRRIRLDRGSMMAIAENSEEDSYVVLGSHQILGRVVAVVRKT